MLAIVRTVLYFLNMTNNTINNSTSAGSGRDPQTGRFLTAENGNIGGPGRRVGSRNRLSEQFIADLRSDWEQHGPAVIDAVRRTDPGTYLRVVAALVPRSGQLDVNVGLDVVLFADKFRAAVAMLDGADPDQARPSYHHPKLINGR
jgi:hypothetical protein